MIRGLARLASWDVGSLSHTGESRMLSRATQEVANWDLRRPQRTIRDRSHLSPLNVVSGGALAPSLLSLP